ncbi:hypothetical protein BJ944DRAFT_254223 [Cunninghamella echinulata]|nr:hypothetical protein BJ944DRAFT_254223 [Cunninghamella echinulata]
MIELLDTILKSNNKLPYYLQTYYIHAKLSLCSLQMDNMVINDSYIDISNNLTDIVKNIQLLSQIIQTNNIANDSYQEQALIKLYKSLQNFQYSSNRLCELVQTMKENSESSSESQLILNYHNYIPSPLSNALLHCGELIPLNLRLSKKKGWINRNTKATNYKEMIQTFVDIMILVAKLQFDVKNENTYHQVYDYLSNAEQFCSDNGFPSGFRWISASYYTFGAAMVTSNIIAQAVYPLRKACTLLEKDTDRCNSDTGKLQLARRYEVLGTCCQREGDFEGAIKAFRMALKRIPYSTIISFTSGSDKMAVSTLIEQKPLVPKLIDRFLRCSISDHEQKSFATEHMDLSGLTATQKCVLYECEVQVLLTLSSRLNLVKQQNWLIHTLLQHYSEIQFPIRRAR